MKNQWISDYIKAQQAAHGSIPVEAVAELIEKLRAALKEDRQVFVFGNGGSAANSSHFATDLGKGASDKVGKRSARVLVLTAKPGQALPFVRAKVWVDSADALIRQFESTDANGVTRRVRLLALSPNVSVKNSAFAFAVPEGVRVVER